MVAKRTFVFLALATIVWAASASALASYYYLQYRNNAEQLSSTQDSLSKLALNYNEAVDKYDLLLSDYSTLYGNYSYIFDANYTRLMKPFESLLANYAKNFTTLLVQDDLNKSYTQVLATYETLEQRGNVTKQEFGNLLNEFYKLFSLSALRELGSSISESATLTVSININYGEETTEWHNNTHVPAGYTLFKLTQTIAAINYTYYASIEPGHILIDSINNKTAYTHPSFTWGYTWIWYYWNGEQNKWVAGPVGCDAWLLKDGGMYKWNYEYWSFP
ncbi:MAG: hypothetical protein ACUVT5_05850 [Candidatus Bathyarchaeales archaeon]